MRLKYNRGQRFVVDPETGRRYPIPAGGAKDDDDSGDQLTLPEDLTALSDEELTELHDRAVSAFEELRGQAEELDDEGMAALEALADAVVATNEEASRRESEAEARRERADELARRVTPPAATTDDDGESDGEGDDDGEDEAGAEASTEEAPEIVVEIDEQPESVEEPEAVAAASNRPSKINLSKLSKRQRSTAPPGAAGEDDYASRLGKTAGFAVADPNARTKMIRADGTSSELNVQQVADMVSARLEGVTESTYMQAYSSGRRIEHRLPAAVVKRYVDPRMRVSRPENTQSVLEYVLSQYKPQPGIATTPLTASAWCAPSTPLYDLCELETTDGLIGLPSMVVERGGIINTTGPDFSDIFSTAGFCFTHDELEAQVPPGSGPKTFYTVTCPEFENTRLGVCGTSVRANLLQNRAYPELVERTVRGTIVTHAHTVAATHIAQMIAGSTAVVMPAKAGATAPVLDAIELQVQHFKYVNRYGRNDVVELVAPYWVLGAIRSDLSRRLGVDLLNISDAVISGWFSDRGVSTQFIVNFDDLTGDAGDFVAWPDTAHFLLYAPGTWVAGAADVVRIDTLFDSALLETNDFVALFMEEGLLTLKTCNDSRYITVPICPDGSTHGGIDIDCDGSEVAEGV